MAGRFRKIRRPAAPADALFVPPAIPRRAARSVRWDVPLLIVPVLILLALLILIALIPLSLVQRYRVGTSRQRARGWLATINLTGHGLSAVLFLAGAALTTIWVPGAFTYAAAGFAAGLVLGMIGLRLTRWEHTAGGLHYTPNALLVLAVMLVVTGRVLYGLWRAWETWRAGLRGESWFVEAGLATAMAAGAVVLGYYLAYWIGVRRRYRRHATGRFRVR